MTEQAIEDALAGKTAQALVTLRTKTIPAQNIISQHVNEIVDLQQRETEKRLTQTTASYAWARSLMLVLGGAATVLGY